MRTTSLAAWLAAALCLAVPGPAAALTATLASDEELVEQAALIVRVEVLDTHGFEERGLIFTEVETRGIETASGIAPEELIVRALGGKLASGEAQSFRGAPRFRPGDRMLLFLDLDDRGAYRVLHLGQGAFREVEGADGPVYLRDLDGVRPRADAAGTLGPLGGPRDGGRFLGWVRDRVAGRPGPADYFAASPAPSAPSTGAPVSTPVAGGDRYSVLREGNSTALEGAGLILFDDSGDVISGNFCDGDAATSATEVRLGWVDDASNEDGFSIEGSSPLEGFAEVGVAAAEATDFLVRDLVAGRPYTFRVRSRNGSGVSEASNGASVSPQADPTAPCVAGGDTPLPARRPVPSPGPVARPDQSRRRQRPG